MDGTSESPQQPVISGTVNATVKIWLSGFFFYVALSHFTSSSLEQKKATGLKSECLAGWMITIANIYRTILTKIDTFIYKIHLLGALNRLTKHQPERVKNYAHI